MRKYTLLLSITFHVAAALMLVMVPLFAAAPLPDIRESISWVPARVATPPQFGDPKSVKPSSSSTAASTAPPQPIPLEASSGAREETGPSATGPASDFDYGLGRGVLDGWPGGDPGLVAVAPPLPPPAPRTVEPRTPVRVGVGLVAPKKTHHVPPVYPPVALAAGRAGIVVLEAVISANGGVDDVRILRSVALLDQAAIDAVRQWRFTPTMLNGEAVPIVMTVTVNFQLK